MVPRRHSARIRVLVVEDTHADRVLLKRHLDQTTESIFSAFVDRLEAAEREANRNWDVVLLDLHLPGSRGIDTLELAKEIFPKTPIIVLTGSKDETLGERALKAGAQDYLGKSEINSSILQRTIRYSCERFKMLMDLAEQRTRLKDILEQTSDGIIAVDSAGSVIFANKAALEIVGESLEALKAKPWEFVIDQEEEQLRTFEHPERGKVIAEIRTKRTSSEAETLYLCSLRDVTEESRLQNGLIEREKMAAVGELSSGIAHEFNNLLAAVQANIELMLLRDEQDELGQNVLTAIDRGKTLVQDLMTFNPHKAPQEGRTALVRYFAKNAAVIDKLLGPTIELKIDPCEQDWSVPMGPGLLNQIVINVTVNARDAMKTGGELRIHFTPSPRPRSLPDHPDKTGIQVTFEDTGAGMPEEVRQRVFDAFFTTKGRNGNGLGLTAVYNLVRECGGDIAVTSEQGLGTQFHLWLPSQEVDEDSITDSAEERVFDDPRPLRVLFVEDEELLRMAMSSYLDTRGHDVTSVEDGQAALDAIELTNQPFDAVVSDQVMPRLNGTGFIEQAFPLMPEAVFILTSAHEMRVIGKDWPLFDKVRFLPKPYHGHELHEMIVQQISSPDRPGAQLKKTRN